MKKVCPTCGHTVVGVLDLELVPASRTVAQGVHVAQLSKTMFEIVAVLAEHYPNSVHIERIVWALYGNRIDGGPDTAESVVAVTMVRIRRAFSAANIRASIAGNWHREYRLCLPETAVRSKYAAEICAATEAEFA